MLNFSNLYRLSLESIRRFPLVMLVAFVGTISMSLLLESARNVHWENTFLRIVLSCILLMPLQIAWYLLKEKGDFDKYIRYVPPIVLFPLLYYLLENVGTQSGVIQYFVFFVFCHLLFSWVVYRSTEEKIAFWDFNQSIFLHLVVSQFLTHLLYGGISIALIALNMLFEAGIKDMVFIHLWVFCLGIVHTLLFLGRVPSIETSRQGQSWKEFPTVLKITVQYILLPLVVVYLVILYGYMGKIIITWSMPKGWVSYLVLCFSIAGILSLLFIEPLREKSENQWIKKYSYYFYRALLPLIGLLFIAIGKRIYYYGFTEPRYYVLLLALWLLFISLYFIFSREKTVQAIPISLSVAALVALVPPISATYVSRHSQWNRLTRELEQAGILKDGKIVPNPSNLSEGTVNNIRSIIQYLALNHPPELFRDYLSVQGKKELDSLIKNDPHYSRYLVMDLIDNEILKGYEGIVPKQVLHLTFYNQTKWFPLQEGQKGYFFPDFVINDVQLVEKGSQSNAQTIDGYILRRQDSLSISIEWLGKDNKLVGSDTLLLNELTQRLEEKHNTSNTSSPSNYVSYTLTSENKPFKMSERSLLYPQHIDVDYDKGTKKMKIKYLEGALWIKE